MPRIPRHFHFVWLRPRREPLPLPWYLALASCFAVNAPERVSLYVLEEPVGDLWDRIKGRLDMQRVALRPEVEAVPATSPLRRFRWAHHADFIRLDKLLDHGGVYADLDTLFVRPLPERLFDERFVIGHEAPVDGRPSLSNCLMLAEPGSELVARWRRAMSAAFDGRSWTGHSCELITRLVDQHPELAHVEPMRSFSAFEHTVAGVRRLMTGRDPDLDGVLSVHLCAHTWWSWDVVWRTSLFGAMLTPDWIRAVDTTYTTLARPHLPPGPPPSRTRAAALRGLLRLVRATDAALDRTERPRAELLRRVRPLVLPLVHAARRLRSG
ncbi:MAG: hypothetical protein IT385_06345 [Deltaproteobacteria bacterium]|nr:hypothetical protein [Deltaproteobacteria bacterium]